MNFFNFFKRICNHDSDAKLSVYVSSNKGKIRDNNEDNYFIDELGARKQLNYSEKCVFDTDRRRIFAVCDGMGGESYGDEASYIVASALNEFLPLLIRENLSDLKQQIDKFASEANNKICDMIREKKCKRSGSTLAMVCIEKTTVYTYNIGDSRVYYFNNNILKQITEDQTLAAKKVKANIYTEEEAQKSSDAHKVISFIGVDSRGVGLHVLDYLPFDIGNGVILICSDGLTDLCSNEEIVEVLSDNNVNPAEALVDKALDNGGTDNITCITINKSY